ncbi:MAG: PAS domain-containing protein [Gammaproteobacteria bacterium]|nr:PAS domain-containing protein [Gammaproteobacteria bacterium]
MSIAALSTLLDALDDEALALVDGNGCIVAWNRAAETLTRRAATDVLGTPLDALDLGDLGRIMPGVSPTRSDEVTVDDARAGALRVRLRALPEGGHVLRFRAAPAAEPSDGAALTRLAAVVPGLLFSFRCRADGTFEFPYMSGQFLRETLPGGVSFQGDAALSFVHPDDLDGVLASIGRAGREEREWHAEFRVRLPQLGERCVEGRAVPVPGAEGVLVWYGALHDVERRKAAELALAASAAKFRSYVEDAPFALFVSGDDGRIVDCNAAAVELLGYPAAALTGMSLATLHPEPLPATVSASLAAASAVCRVEFDEQMRRADGRLIDIQLRAVRMRDGQTLSFVQDITQRRRTQVRERLHSEVNRVLAEAQSLHEATPRLLAALCGALGWDLAAVWVIDERSRVLRCRGTWHRGEGAIEALAGYTRAVTFATGVGLPGRVWATQKLVHVAPVCAASGCLRAELATAAGLDSALGIPVIVDGRLEGVIDALGRGITAPDAPLRALFATLGDQLGQFIARRRAQDAAERFLSSSPAVIYALRVEAGELRTTWISDNVLALTGDSREDALAPDWWARRVHPADLPAVRAAHPWPYTAGAQTLEYRLRRADGEYRWVRDEKRPHGGELIGALSDVSERVRLEDQLRQAQKMEAIGQLAAGVAHDFNNLLTVILGYSGLLIAAADPHDPRRQQLVEIRGAGERAAALTRQLLAFSRKQILEPRIVDLNEALTNIERMLHRLIGENVTLSLALAPELSRVRVDPVQFEQVVMNLAVNARDAMPEGGRLTIATRDVVLDTEACRRCPELKPGRHTVIVIADTGCGMPPDVQAHIFEPFFTTKESGKGTGLGLATVFGIVRQSEGRIEVATAPGAGTCFTIYLPAIDRSGAPAADGAGAAPSARSGETVLLVEDEEDVRQITRLMLEQAGYRVVEAATGAQALTLAADPRCTPDVLLTDVVMPEMSGRQLAEQLRLRYPKLQAVFMSGYTDAAMVKHGLVDLDAAFVNKPFAVHTLAAKLREVLGPGEPGRG